MYSQFNYILPTLSFVISLSSLTSHLGHFCTVSATCGYPGLSPCFSHTQLRSAAQTCKRDRIHVWDWIHENAWIHELINACIGACNGQMDTNSWLRWCSLLSLWENFHSHSSRIESPALWHLCAGCSFQLDSTCLCLSPFTWKIGATLVPTL